MRKLFAGFLVAVILLGGDLIWRAWAQGPNLFCSATQACTVTALWNYTGGLQAGGVSVATLPVSLATQTSGQLNLATQVTGTLPGANYAAVNLAAGNVNGGVGGVLPGANMAATNLAASGNGGVTGVLPVANEGTGTPASGKYVDGGTGAWTALTAGGVSEASLFCNQISPLGTSDPQPFCPFVVFASAHTLIRFTAFNSTVPAGCTIAGVVAFRDETTPSTLQSLTLTNGVALEDSGVISVTMTAGHRFAFAVTTTPSGCTTSPSFFMAANYQ